jgi:hypothetical protein
MFLQILQNSLDRRCQVAQQMKTIGDLAAKKWPPPSILNCPQRSVSESG